MIIIETPIFSRLIVTLMSDDEYRTLQEVLIQHPGLGAIIQGTGGLRKLRWAQGGRGKRGGMRVIYYWQKNDEQLYMLYGYPKSEQQDLT
ncbi:MAG TPA: type II toxin-antitoxin system RelE/ParE family toxin, partial [Hyphomicrobiales bacterium]|nr:type II toxin-antitoxin system RelE/ParE family toxin [Hyphomicrobiales bacterium]